MTLRAGSHELFCAMPMSFNPQHQAENLAAADLDLTDSELALLNGMPLH